MPRQLPKSLTAAPPAIVPPPLQHHAAISPQQFATEHRGRFSHLCVGALIFRRHAPPGGAAQSQILLLQRAATDYAPGIWEVPGGGVEPAEDATVLHAVVREVFEETGLRVGSFVRQVWDRREGEEVRLGVVATGGEGEGDGRGEGVVVVGRVPGWGEVEFLDGEGGVWWKLYFEVGVGEVGDVVDVVLDKEEHQDWGWFSQEDVKGLEVISVQALRVLENGFEAFEGSEMDEMKEMETT